MEETDINLDYEKLILGGILVEPERLSVISNILKEEHFWDASHREIFKTILEIHKEQNPISVLTVADKLTAKGTLKEKEKEIGIVPYLTLTLDNYDIARNDTFYCKAIVEKYYVRKMKEETGKSITTENALKIVKNIAEYGEQLAQLQLLGKPPEPLNIEKATELLKTTKGGKITRYTELDKLINFAPSELIIIGARTRHGKTTFAMNLMLNMAKEYSEETFVFFSYETNYERFFTKMLSWASGLGARQIKDDHLCGNITEEIKKGIEKLKPLETQKNIYIVTDPSYTVEQIVTYCKQIKKSHPIGAIFVDYIGIVNEPRTDTEELRVAAVTHKLRIASQELNAPVIACTQMNRAAAKENRRPTLEGLRYSGQQEQEASIVLGLFNVAKDKIDMEPEAGEAQDTAETDLEVIVLKNRYGPSNKIIKLNYNTIANTITE